MWLVEEYNRQKLVWKGYIKTYVNIFLIYSATWLYPRFIEDVNTRRRFPFCVLNLYTILKNYIVNTRKICLLR